MSTTMPIIDVGDPPPSTINVTVIAGPLAAEANVPLGPNVYATGVRSILTIRITDQDNKPLVGWTIKESNQTLESLPANNPTAQSSTSRVTDSNGSIQDYFAANANFSNYRLDPGAAREAVNDQLRQRSHWFGEQTLSISSPAGGLVAVAVYRRRISNLFNGNVNDGLIPYLNSRGNYVNNFQPPYIGNVTVTYPK